jgi:hypothetical protein
VTGPPAQSSVQIATVEGSIVDTSCCAVPTIVIEIIPFAPRLKGFGHDGDLMSKFQISFTTWIVWSHVAVFPHESVAVQVRMIVVWKRCASHAGTWTESV